MDQEIEKILQAITIASDSSQSSFQEALGYLGSIQQNASETWRLALHIFVEASGDGSRKYPPQARFFSLRVLDDFLDNRFEPFDQETFQTLQQALVSYVQSEYVYGKAEASAPYIRNKFSHTLTLFFLCTYTEQWPTFFTDLFTLMRPNNQPTFNRHISLLFFHIILEISGEVADQMIKAARQFTTQRHARDARVRDAVRERDAVQINEAVLAIVAEAAEKMARLQKEQNVPELPQVEEVVDWGVRAFASYVGWIDINLTVTPTTVPLLFTLLADQSLPIRLATSAALLRIVAKGLKEPSDKLQLIKVLSLGQVIDALERKTRQEQIDRGPDTDEGEESYREALGKLLNMLGLELLKLDEAPSEEVRSEASEYLSQTLPILLRFLADEFDDTCSTVFPFLSTVLSGYKKKRKTTTAPIEPEKRAFLASLLQVILDKMKWDIDADPEDPEDDDNTEFEKIRKELRNFMDAVLVIDQDLVTEAVRSLALSTIEAYKNGVEMKWNEAELGIHMVYIFGEINKSGGKGRAAFCLAPSSTDKEANKSIDFSKYPLTPHGELLFALVQSGMSAYPHQAVALQFFETVSRYGDFFKVRKECIVPTLEAMIDSRGIHNQNSSFRSRLYYLFYRFIKEERNDIPPQISVTIAESLRDLLTIQVVLPNPDDVEVDMLTDAVKNSAFDSQLYLFETVGILCSLLFKTPDQQKSLLLSFVKPLMDELSEALQAYRANGNQDLTSIVKVHHIIMALGNIAKGFPDYPSPLPVGYILPPLDVFAEIAQAMLVCLENMNVFKVTRDATRFAFARILATAGPTVTHFIPPLMTNLLIHFEPSELVDFMNFIALLIFKLRDDMFDVLDQLVGPLTAHISASLSRPISGSDDERSHSETKKAYLALLTSVMSAGLQGVFISPRNNPSFDSLMETMRILSEDVSDPPNQKAAFTFLSRCVSAWAGTQQPAQPTPNGNSNHNPLNDVGIPGFERYVYERLVPAAFSVPAVPNLNLKDGQVTVVLHEIANFLQAICKTRGPEAYNYFLTVFLPSQGWPPDTAMEFTTKLKDLDPRSFRKYFTDFVRSSRS
ncbi:pre-tRNA nuclear export protein [Paramarasmius palmivorus]|uniref:Exportin-T n=1 Tax=Paramarasmius palmivorus TaxID=297713 RepID=A0AAW0DEL9_9AGAR